MYWSLIPRPCTLVACSMKLAQKAWSTLSCDVCRRRIFTSHPAYSDHRVAEISTMKLAEPETGHMHMIDYNSKLEMKKTS